MAFVFFGQFTVSAQLKNQGAIGSVTIDGKVWNQVAMRPDDCGLANGDYQCSHDDDRA